MRYNVAGAPIVAAAVVLFTTIACQPSPTSTPREVLVRGADYAFELPDTLAPGTTILRFQNTGKVAHEFGMALLKPGVTLAQVLDVVRAGGSPDSLLDGTVGILIAAPSATTVGALLVDLLPGRTYAMFCNFQDSPDKPPHSSLGMVTSRSIPGGP
jgi:hypothetical protein